MITSISLSLTLALCIAPPPASQASQKEKASQIFFHGGWVQTKDRKAEDTNVFNAPFIVLDLKDGDFGQVEDNRGQLRKGVFGRGQIFRSSGELRIKGSKFPLTASAKYDFEDDNHHHFTVDRSFEVSWRSGQCALADKDNTAILILTWTTEDRKPTSAPAEKPDAQYLIDAIVLCLDPGPMKDPYQINLPPDETGQIKDWYHAGPIRATKSKGHAQSYRGPTKRNRDGSPVALDDYDYEGTLNYDVLTNGFPVRIKAKFEFEDVKKKNKLFQITGEAEFRKPGDVTIVRSKAGDHLLVLRLSPASESSPK